LASRVSFATLQVRFAQNDNSGDLFCHVERSETSLIFLLACATMIIGFTFLQINTAQHCISESHNITRRLWQHRHGEIEGFTKHYRLNRLVWIEHFRKRERCYRVREETKGLATQQESRAG